MWSGRSACPRRKLCGPELRRNGPNLTHSENVYGPAEIIESIWDLKKRKKKKVNKWFERR